MQQEAITAKPVLNIYLTPSQDSEVGSQSIFGWSVLTLDAKDGWVQVRTADGYEGWVMETGLSTPAGLRYAATSAVWVCQLSANLYREPDVTRHAPLLNVPCEARLEVGEEDADEQSRWLQVRLVDGRLAYVQKGDVSSEAAPLDIEATLQLAYKFMGVTYTWGGTSSYGFDCSGYTQMLLRQRGIVLPRDADVQAAWSGFVAVDLDRLRPGDLLFFGDQGSRITHTGMYAGDGAFLHSTSIGHPGVQVSRLDETPWKDLLICQRRLK